jgi:hypothetical protein
MCYPEWNLRSGFRFLELSGHTRPNSRFSWLCANANPLEDIRNTQKIAAVIVNGRYLSRAGMDKMLAGVGARAK